VGGLGAREARRARRPRARPRTSSRWSTVGAAALAPPPAVPGRLDAAAPPPRDEAPLERMVDVARVLDCGE